MRLDQYVAQYWPEHSRATWQKYIIAGCVSVNGVVEISSKKMLGEDDEVTVNLPDKTDYSERTLPIIFENDDVIVMNKPSGVLTHSKGETNDEFTVADFVGPRMSEPEMTNRPGIVHRLDRATSGIIIAAKHSAAKHHLQKQFQDRKAKKEYLAIVRGIPKHPEATIDIPIERNPKEPAKFRVGASGKSAQTSYKVLAHNERFAVLSLKPTTGRTHQLRVHLEYLGTPILGDDVYGGGKSPIGRLALHARSLEITLPGGSRQTFVAEPPQDFIDFIDAVTASTTQKQSQKQSQEQSRKHPS